MKRIFAAVAAMVIGSTVQAAAFVDPHDTPAMQSPLAARAVLNGVALAGSRLVAVGQRGHIVYSDDHGLGWKQANVPVAADLTAVFFTSRSEGWAVGHDGVILHTVDAALSWKRRFDGRADKAIAGQPLLDIWFDGRGHGLAVGAFGLLLRSDDGGASWQHAEALADNPKALHLNAIRAVGPDLYLVGEQGLLLKRSAGGSRFEALATSYGGSFFGLAGHGQQLVAFGLRGTAMFSGDGGRNWARASTGTETGLAAGITLAGGAVLLLTQSGTVLRSTDGGASFAAQAGAVAAPSTAALMFNKNRLLVAGARGVRVLAVDGL
ncbi:MAG: YCF48-related protein [Pseudomonadota bacterium]